MRRKFANCDFADVVTLQFGDIFVDRIIKLKLAALDTLRQQRSFEHLFCDEPTLKKSELIGRLWARGRN